MNAQSQTVEIDGIVLEGLNVTPERAERIRALLEPELRRRLEEEGILERLAGGDVVLPLAPSLDRDLSSVSDEEVANILAEGIVQSLHYAELAKGKEDDYV